MWSAPCPTIPPSLHGWSCARTVAVVVFWPYFQILGSCLVGPRLHLQASDEMGLGLEPPVPGLPFPSLLSLNCPTCSLKLFLPPLLLFLCSLSLPQLLHLLPFYPLRLSSHSWVGPVAKAPIGPQVVHQALPPCRLVHWPAPLRVLPAPLRVSNWGGGWQAAALGCTSAGRPACPLGCSLAPPPPLQVGWLVSSAVAQAMGSPTAISCIGIGVAASGASPE
uniref:Uncharacterized protein n=1 Tax=Sphaerodactylus townsendi TaxID=933632 RepID=A0ACB8FS16_9SAUR